MNNAQKYRIEVFVSKELSEKQPQELREDASDYCRVLDKFLVAFPYAELEEEFSENYSKCE